MNKCNPFQIPLGLLLSSVAALTACQSEDTGADETVNIYTVSREDLPITVKESGELLALKETNVRSEVEGQATILYLVPEGTRVKPGDKLVELDVSELVEKRANQEIALEKARSALEQARTQQQILESELTTKFNTARSQLTIAEMELEKLLGAMGGKGSQGKNIDMVRLIEKLVTPPAEPEEDTGEDEWKRYKIVAAEPQNYAGLVPKVIQLLQITGEDGKIQDPLQRDMGEMANKILQQADQIRLQMADLKLKEDTFSHSFTLESKQFITRNELDRDLFNYQSQASKVMIAWNDLELLINYALARDKIELTQNLANAKLELTRVIASNDAERKKSEFDVDAKRREFEVAEERLQNLNTQINNAIIYSPGDGLVVYARTQNRRGGESIEEGTSVRQRQSIIILPDNTKLQCVIKVQEAQIDKVMVGQAAHISVEAFPTEILTGKVTRVAPVADSSNSWMGNDKKVYTTIVELDGLNDDERLRSRMAASATITVETIKRVLTAPIQAVRRDRSVNYVWLKTQKGPVATPVVVGAHNQEKVEILDGLSEGDVVFRTPPGGQPDPKFDQPALPELAPTVRPTGGGDTIVPAAGGDSIDAAGADTQPRRRGGGSNGGGGRTGGRGGMFSAFTKKLADMTPEELASAKTALDESDSMVERLREMSPERADAMAASLETIRAAMASNDLEAAQASIDAMMASMRRRPGGGGRGPAGGGGGGGGGNPREGG